MPAMEHSAATAPRPRGRPRRARLRALAARPAGRQRAARRPTRPVPPPPWPGIVILHGAGSRKENHADFARLAAANGWAALAFDPRGHGASRARCRRRVATSGRWPACWRHERRGSPPGRRARVEHGRVPGDPRRPRRPEVAGVIAICPAGEERPRPRATRGELEMRVAAARTSGMAREHDLREPPSRPRRPAADPPARRGGRPDPPAGPRSIERAGEPSKLGRARGRPPLAPARPGDTGGGAALARAPAGARLDAAPSPLTVLPAPLTVSSTASPGAVHRVVHDVAAPLTVLFTVSDTATDGAVSPRFADGSSRRRLRPSGPVGGQIPPPRSRSRDHLRR